MNAEINIVELSGDLSDNTKQRMWPNMAGQGIVVTEDKVFIAHDDALYVQSRSNKHEHELINLKQYDKQNIKVKSIYIQKESLLYQARVENELLYNTYKYCFKNGLWDGPIRRPLNPGKLHDIGEGKLAMSGNMRPGQLLEYAHYALLNRDGKWDEIEIQQQTFYKTAQTYFMSIYDTSFTLVDTFDRIDRQGEDIRYFERLYMAYPFDLDNDKTIYLVDNSDGYQLEKWSAPYSDHQRFKLENSAFKPIPYNLSEAMFNELKTKSAAYSTVYVVYVCGGDILSGFYQAPVYQTPVLGPYYFDITSLEGHQEASGEMDYPIVAKDDTDRLFVYAVLPGGWFSHDRLFLVGLTVQDLVDGKAKKIYLESKLKIWADAHP